jgi:5-methylcytosine-specific restriction endonuclease McrA
LLFLKTASTFNQGRALWNDCLGPASATEGGEDSIENAVALCPNCHRKMHVLNLTPDIKKLNDKAIGK